MALYVVLRHPDNPEQAWSNAWQPDKPLVDAIMTNNDVAPLCNAAQRAGEYVYVHRCAWGVRPQRLRRGLGFRVSRR
jgi:hypothetical protein